MTTEMFLAFCMIISEAIIIYKYEKSNYFYCGPTGDSAAYYFHFNDWASGVNRCSLAKDTKPVIPYVFFYILRLVNNRFIYRHSYLFSLTLRYFSAIFILFFFEPNSTVEPLLIIALFFFASPAHGTDKNCIQFVSLSPRYVHSLICSLLLLALYTKSYMTINEHFYYIVIYILSMIVLMGSYFSRQWFLFVFLPVVLLSDEVNFLVFIILAFLCLCLSKGYRETLGNQFNQYVKTVAFDIHRIRNSVRFDRWGHSRNFLFKSTFTRIGLSNKWQVIVLVLFTFAAYSHQELLAVAFVLCAVLVLISLKHLAWLGEAWRYSAFSLQFIFPFAILNLMAQLPEQQQSWICLTVPLVLLLKAFLIDRLPLISSNKELVSLFKGVDRCELSGCVFAVNFRNSTIAVNEGFGTRATEFPIGALSKIDFKETFDRERGYPFLSESYFLSVKSEVCAVIIEKDSFNRSWSKLLGSANFTLFSDSENYELWVPYRSLR